MPSFLDTIASNSYVKETKPNTKRNIHSFSSLVDTLTLSQSDAIKLGLGMEKVVSDYISSNSPHLTWIRPTNKKGSKERDHLFVDENEKKKAS